MQTQQSLTTAAIVTLALLLAACAQTPVAPARQQAKVDECGLLQEVLAQDDLGYTGLKTRKILTRRVNIWQTRPVFPGTDCQVWEWGQDLVHYGCDWPQADESAARETFNTYVPRIQQCLGPQWGTRKLTGKTGEGALFSKPGEDTAIALRYFRDKGPSGGWQTSLVVGKQSRIKLSQ
jgi:hypothetical protein